MDMKARRILLSLVDQLAVAVKQMAARHGNPDRVSTDLNRKNEGFEPFPWGVSIVTLPEERSAFASI